MKKLRLHLPDGMEVVPTPVTVMNADAKTNCARLTCHIILTSTTTDLAATYPQCNRRGTQNAKSALRYGEAVVHASIASSVHSCGQFAARIPIELQHGHLGHRSLRKNGQALACMLHPRSQMKNASSAHWALSLQERQCSCFESRRAARARGRSAR